VIRGEGFDRLDAVDGEILHAWLPCRKAGGAAGARKIPRSRRRPCVQLIRRHRSAQGNSPRLPASNHRKFAMHAVLEKFAIKRGDSRSSDTCAAWARRAGVRGAMRPSNATAQWLVGWAS